MTDEAREQFDYEFNQPLPGETANVAASPAEAEAEMDAFTDMMAMQQQIER